MKHEPERSGDDPELGSSNERVLFSSNVVLPTPPPAVKKKIIGMYPHGVAPYHEAILTTDTVHKAYCACRCGDENNASNNGTLSMPLVERILKQVSFRTLLVFRGTNKHFRDKIDKALDHLVVVERAGLPPFFDPIMYIRASTGYRIFEAASTLNVWDSEEQTETPSAKDLIAGYLSLKASDKMRKDNNKGSENAGTLIIDIYGEVLANLPTLQKFLAAVVHIKEIRHLPGTRGAHSSTTVLTQHDAVLVLFNDWLALRRTVKLVQVDPAADSVPNVVYLCNGYLRTAHPEFVNTFVQGAKKVVYDFSRPEWNVWPGQSIQFRE